MNKAEPCNSGLRHLDSSQHKAHKHTQIRAQPVEGRLIGTTKGDPNTKLNAITDSWRRPVALTLTSGQQSEYDGAIDQLISLKNVTLVADKGYVPDPFRVLIKDWANESCIPVILTEK